MIQAVVYFADGSIKGRYTVATMSDLEAQVDFDGGETFVVETIIVP